MEWYMSTLIIIPIVIIIIIIFGCLPKIKKIFPFYLCVKNKKTKKGKFMPYFAKTFEVIDIFNGLCNTLLK